MSTKTKFQMGLAYLGFAPITADGDSSTLPTYGSTVTLGHAVRAALTVNSADVPVYGDDALQLKIDSFLSGSLETETLLSDLELDSTLYGGTYASAAGITRTIDDAGTPGAVPYIRKLMKKDKSIVYRAGILLRCAANRAASGWESNTKKDSVEVTNAKVNFDVMPCATGAWNWEQDYTSETDALAAIEAKLHPSTT